MPVYRCPRLYGKSHTAGFGVIVRKIMPDRSYMDWVVRNPHTVVEAGWKLMENYW
jgi:hypothetical protein